MRTRPSPKDQANHAITLTDIMEVIPSFVSQYYLPICSDGDGIRTLRRVSKQMSRIACRDITSFTIDLCSPACSDSAYGKLLAGARLNRLQVRLVLPEGPPHPRGFRAELELISQMSSYVSRVKWLTTSLRSPLSTTAHLYLKLACSSLTTAFSSRPNNTVEEMCGILYRALPHLVTLTLDGRSTQHALKGFIGVSGVRYLYVQISEVPASALADINVHLPKLYALSLFNASMTCTSTRFQEFVDAAFPSLSTCHALEELHMSDVSGAIQLQCTNVWQLLPASLHVLKLDMEIGSLFLAPALLGNAVYLSLRSSQGFSPNGQPTNLLDIFDMAPNLTCLLFPPGSGINVDLGMHPDSLTSFKQHILDGFSIRCDSFTLKGSCASIENLLQWCPVSRAPNTLTLSFVDSPHSGAETGAYLSKIMHGVLRVAPQITDLKLVSDVLSVPVDDIRFLEPLMQFKSLKSLGVWFRFYFGSQSLMNLFKRVPSLCSVACLVHDATTIGEVIAQMRLAKRTCSITKLQVQ